MDELVCRLEELQAQAESMSGVMNGARDGVAAASDGADRTRSVRVEVGQDGLPTRFQVAPDWQRRFPPAAFGSAVMEAYSVAIGARLADWAAGLRQPPSGFPPIEYENEYYRHITTGQHLLPGEPSLH
jgi:hypothetical protein